MPVIRCPEGATPIDDISGLKIKGVYTLKRLNELESRNITDAVLNHLSRKVPHPRKWFKTDKLISIHKDMFCNVWDWAGKFRSTNLSIGIQPFMISTELKNYVMMCCIGAQFHVIYRL